MSATEQTLLDIKQHNYKSVWLIKRMRIFVRKLK